MKFEFLNSKEFDDLTLELVIIGFDSGVDDREEPTNNLKEYIEEQVLRYINHREELVYKNGWSDGTNDLYYDVESAYNDWRKNEI